jgi:hypothetical protein
MKSQILKMMLGKVSVKSLSSKYYLIVDIACRVEFAKAHARARRYAEEEELVLEEMRRTLQYFQWKADWWRSWGCSHQQRRVESGRKAYAEKQAVLLEELSMKFNKIWQTRLKELALPVMF